jgi:hypothetical protein
MVKSEVIAMSREWADLAVENGIRIKVFRK